MTTATKSVPSRNDVWKMFDRIAHRYDRLNRMLSMGIDVGWRKKLARRLPENRALAVLDLATGTGDHLVSLLDARPQIKKAVGLDLSEKMLEIGRAKLARRYPERDVDVKLGDAIDLPEEDASFDAVSMSFGIRNVAGVDLALGEMYRVLKSGGRVLILEFSLPKKGFIRSSYLIYLRHILPRIGALLSGDAHAYRYLNETIETFPHGRDFCDLLELAGFHTVRATPLTFGIATIYQGDKQ